MSTATPPLVGGLRALTALALFVPLSTALAVTALLDLDYSGTEFDAVLLFLVDTLSGPVDRLVGSYMAGGIGSVTLTAALCTAALARCVLLFPCHPALVSHST